MADKDDNLISTENTDAISVADVFINLIIVQLHEKAIEQIKDTNYTVLNSAIDGEGKNAKFFGAGLHMIAAIPQEKGNKIPIKVALSMLKTYVQWFVGPDLKTSIEEKDLVALDSDDSSKQSDKTEDNKNVNDSTIYVPTFSLYLLLEDGKSDEEDPEVTAQKTDAENVRNAKHDKDEKDAKDASESKSAAGYYITYSMEIEGQKEHPLADALKKFGTNVLDGFGIKLGNWRTGASGEAHTIGDLKNALDKVFGSIDPDKLQSDYQKNLQQDFKHTQALALIYDTKTIVNMLKALIPSSARSKIKSAEYALCTRVSTRDKSYELFNLTKIANTITKSIQGLYKKFKNKISKDDVILVNNYNDEEKNKSDNKFVKKKEVADSLISRSGNLITEAATEKLTLQDVQKELQKLCDAKLSKQHAISQVATSDKIIEKMKSFGIDEPTFFEELRQTKYSFLIRTKEKIELQESSNKNVNVLLTKLFERQLIDKEYNKSVLNTVKKVFLNLILTFKDNRPNKDEKLKFDATEKLVPMISDTIKKESMSAKLGILKLYFEDLNVEETLMSEASNDGINVGKNIIDKKGAKNLLANMKKMTLFVKDHYVTPKGKPKEESIRYKALQLFDEFTKCKSDEEMKKFLDDKFENGSKETLDKPLRTAFIEALQVDGIPDKEDDTEEKAEKITVTFYDYDPKKDERVAEPLDKLEIEKGTAANASNEGQTKFEELNKKLTDAKKEGYQFRGWDPDAGSKLEEDTDLVAKYIKDEDKDKQFKVVFLYPPDPADTNKVEQIDDELGELTVKAGEAAKAPKPPEIDGWKFEKWSEDFNKVEDDMMVLAEYLKAEAEETTEKDDMQDVFYVIPDENNLLGNSMHKVQFVIPDFNKPDDKSKWKEFGEQYSIDASKKLENGKDFKYPDKTPDKLDGHEFKAWNPTFEEFSKNSIDKYESEKYTKEDKDGNAIICIQATFDGQDTNEVKTKNTGLDFYIVPMKGLKYKDDDLARNLKK